MFTHLLVIQYEERLIGDSLRYNGFYQTLLLQSLVSAAGIRAHKNPDDITNTYMVEAISHILASESYIFIYVSYFLHQVLFYFV